MEQDRAPALFLHQPELERQASTQFETIVNLIGGTRTRSGLKVQAILDTNPYPTGVEISDDEIDKLRIKRHAKLPAWNYTLSPRFPTR